MDALSVEGDVAGEINVEKDVPDATNVGRGALDVC